MLHELKDKVLTIETPLVSEAFEYEHIREPFSGVPSIMADWAELATTSREAEAVFRAAICALSWKGVSPAPDNPFLHAERVRIVPPTTLSELELQLQARIGAAHRAVREREAAEALHAKSVRELAEMDARRAKLEPGAELAESERQAAEVAEIQARAEGPDATEPADTGTTKEPDPS